MKPSRCPSCRKFRVVRGPACGPCVAARKRRIADERIASALAAMPDIDDHAVNGTTHFPGTVHKQAVVIRREQLGIPLWNVLDAGCGPKIDRQDLIAPVTFPKPQ